MSRRGDNYTVVEVFHYALLIGGSDGLVRSQFLRWNFTRSNLKSWESLGAMFDAGEK